MLSSLLEAARIALVAAMAAPAAISAHAAPPQVAATLNPPARIQLSPEMRGDLAMVHQQYIAAIEDYDQVPLRNAVIWNKLGIAYHHLFAFDEAKRDYQRALHLRPRYPQALNNLGTVYYARKKYRKAQKLFRKSLRLDPGAAEVYSNLGVAYFADGKTTRGIAAFREAFALNPNVFAADSPQMISSGLPTYIRARQDYCVARLFAQSGNFSQAIEFLRRALDEGFSDDRDLYHDQMLASLRATPEFAELMNQQKLTKK